MYDFQEKYHKETVFSAAVMCLLLFFISVYYESISRFSLKLLSRVRKVLSASAHDFCLAENTYLDLDHVPGSQKPYPIIIIVINCL